jgi:exodeoxyribonuclease VII large subunit
VVESDKKKSPEKYYSLLELTSSIQTVIKKTYTSSYWVKAEIAKLNYYPKSGHCYPDLVEKEKGVVLAQIRATIWAGQFNDLAKKFLLVTNEPLSDGMTVLVRTSVNYHPVYGLGLQITDIQPSFTLGEMARERLHTIEQLKAQNIFERNKQLVPALLIQRIAVISVETSKGYHDFTKIISENEWGYKFFLMLFPAILQGEAAINSITEQLNRIKKAQKHFDAVVIIRGGGGDIGLSSYDNFKLAKAVALFPLPIITGIGHVTNETVVEMVSFVNKITPTDVGYYLIQKFHNLAVRIQEARNSIVNRSKQISNNERAKLENKSSILKNKTDNVIYNNRLSLMRSTFDFNNIVISFLEAKKNNHKEVLLDLSQKSKNLISLQENFLQESGKRLASSIKIISISNVMKISTLEDKLRLLEPKHVLRRGYSITTYNGKVVIDPNMLQHEDIVETLTYKGKFKSKVQSKRK